MWRNWDSVIRRQREIEGCRRQTENNGGCNAARQKKDTRNTEKMETNDTRSPSGLMGRLGLLWMSNWFSQRLFCTQRCSLQCQSILQTHTHARTLYFVFFEKKKSLCLFTCMPFKRLFFPYLCPLCASATSSLPDRHHPELDSFHFVRPRTHRNTYIRVRGEGLFVLTAPSLRLGSSLWGGVASWRALALFGRLAVCRRGGLTLETHKGNTH